MRTPYSGSVPVAGRPAFLRLTVIDFAIITYNVKASRGEVAASAPALTRTTRGINPMIQATCVYITSPTSTSAIDHPIMFPPRDPTRRHFLTVAAVASVVSAGTLAAATAMDPSVPQAVTVPGRPDPAFALIADKRAADIAHGEA